MEGKSPNERPVPVLLRMDAIEGQEWSGRSVSIFVVVMLPRRSSTSIAFMIDWSSFT
jgi:hypothetical protein